MLAPMANIDKENNETAKNNHQNFQKLEIKYDQLLQLDKELETRIIKAGQK